MNNNTTQTCTVSGWFSSSEDERWDEFLAWCKKQENGPHE